MLPHEQLRAALVPAYSPCTAFESACKGKVQWAPEKGHVPRGFAGGFGPPGDVRLVLVCAEPGNPYNDERYPQGPAASVLEAVCRYVLTAREASTDPYHQNLRYILNGCFPRMEFRKQLERVWITESVLCSAEREGGYVPACVRHECRERYLEPQLRLFPKTALVVALGTKAQQRLRDWPNVQPAHSVAPPGCHRRAARPSWDAVIQRFRLQNRDLP
jgi:uracil-DNA glycosylase